jgi:F-type H+-transporting ATPase subunit b
MESQPQTQMHAETGAHGGEEHIFPPFDTTTFPSQLLWLAVTFALLYFLTAKLILPRLAAIFDARKNAIASDQNAAQTLKTETEIAIAAYDKALRDAREKANAIAQDMRDGLKADIDAERARVEASLALKVADAEKHIAASRNKIMSEVESIASEAASAIVEHLIGSANNGSAISGAVKTALKKTA